MYLRYKLNIIFGVILAVLLIPQVVASQVSSGYSGNYIMSTEGVTLTLILNQNTQGEVTGTLSSTAGTKYKVEGIIEEGMAVGSCYNDKGGLFFEAFLDDKQLLFSLIESDANLMPDYNSVQELLFTKQAGTALTITESTSPTGLSAHRTDSSGQTATSQISSDQLAVPVHTGNKGKMYRHPAGFSFWYPESWTTKDQEEFLQLIPPNPHSTNEGPTEIYGVIGQSIAGEGIYSADDYRIIDFMDQQVRSLSPTLRRIDGSSPVNLSAGKGIVLDWEGKTPQDNIIRARAFVCVINNYGVALIALGFKDHIAERDSNLRKMFASFGFGEGQVDPNLIGSWNFMSTYSIRNESIYETDYSRAQLVSESSSKLVFKADGTWSRSDKSHMLAGGDGVWLESKDESISQGRWNAGDGILYMVWKDDSWEEYKYRVQQTEQGLQLKMVSGKTGEIWNRSE